MAPGGPLEKKSKLHRSTLSLLLHLCFKNRGILLTNFIKMLKGKENNKKPTKGESKSFGDL